MGSRSKNTDHIIWLRFNDKTILVVGDMWKGSPKVASPIDVLLISKKIKRRYRNSFTSNALKDCLVIYMDKDYESKKKRMEKEEMNILPRGLQGVEIKNDAKIIYDIIDASNCHLKVLDNGKIVADSTDPDEIRFTGRRAEL